MICKKDVCKLSCKNCDIFNLSSLTPESIDMTWLGMEKCLKHIANNFVGFKSVVGIQNSGVILAVWLAEAFETSYGTYHPTRRILSLSELFAQTFGDKVKREILVIDAIEENSVTLMGFKKNQPSMKNMAVLVKKKGCQNISKVSAITLDSQVQVIFPWERI